MASAITRNSLLASTAVGAPGTSTTTGSVTISSGALVVCSFAIGDTGGAPGMTSAVASLGAGTQNGNVGVGTEIGNVAARMYWMYFAVGGSSTFTFTWDGAADSAIYQVDEFLGTLPSAPVRQSNTATANTASPSVTLASSPLSGSVTVGHCNHNDTAQTASAGGNFVLLGAGTTTVGTPSQHQAVEWDAVQPAAQTVDFSWSGAGNAATNGIELVLDVDPTTAVQKLRRHMLPASLMRAATR